MEFTVFTDDLEASIALPPSQPTMPRLSSRPPAILRTTALSRALRSGSDAGGKENQPPYPSTRGTIHAGSARGDRRPQNRRVPLQDITHLYTHTSHTIPSSPSSTSSLSKPQLRTLRTIR
eukprot:TRINITY_DN5657_c0_g1_i1.p1 TRINITY_DN5657_c0_g1~~TRINITY_DN5657_c0_g1_i1.p1  ORF type:complete len:120 (+),score=5.03 TRINITY_DN5657_c0_g1_i1:316-675(+)